MNKFYFTKNICQNIFSCIPNQYIKKKPVLFFITFLLQVLNISIAQQPLGFNISSPEAARIGYNCINQKNIYTGEFNYSIPIYTIKVNNYEFPLSINYSYGGFQPEHDPTSLGVGWSSNFSGGIVRHVNGMADDCNSGLSFFSFIEQYNNYDNVTLATKVHLLQKIVDEGADINSDDYLLSTPILSTKFKFSNNQKAIFLDYKKCMLCSDKTETPIIIKDDLGITYKFNEPENTEIEMSTQIPVFDLTTAWMLSSIKYPNSVDSITFEYEDYWTRRFHKNRKFIYKGDFVTYGDYQVSDIYEYSRCKIIKKIVFPGGYIIFNNKIRTISIAHYQDETQQIMLESVEVYNNTDELISKHIFDYININSYYYFLNSIKSVSTNNDTINKYSFEYNLDNVPNKKVANDSVDYWGFYNQRQFNERNIHYSLNPVGWCSLVGSLKKIIHPTKGYSEIQYESNNVPRNSSFNCDQKPIYTHTDTLALYADATNDYFYKELYFKVPYPQAIEIRMEAFAMQYGDYVICKAGNEQTGATVSEGETEDFNQITKNIWLNSNDSIKLSILLTDCQYTNDYGKIIVKYRTMDITDDPVDCNIEVGGIRVLKIIDKINNSFDTTSFRYSAQDINNPNISSGRLANPSPIYKTNKIKKTDHYAKSVLETEPGFYVSFEPIITERYTYYEKTISPLTPLTFLNKHLIYNYVEIIKNNGRDGKTIQEFNYCTEYIPNHLFPELYMESDYRCGKILSETSFNKDNIKVLYKGYNYDDKEDNLSAKIVTKIIKRYPNETTWFLPNGIYKNSTLDLFISDSIIEKPISNNLTRIHEVNRTNNQEIITDKYYEYNNNNFINKIKLIDSKEKAVENTLIYASDINEGIYNDMQNSNMLNYTIEDSKTINNTFIESTRTNYSLTNHGHIKPLSVIHTTDAENTLITYDSYDEFGNVNQYTTKDGIPVSIIWSYNNQYPVIVAKNTTIETLKSIAIPHAISLGISMDSWIADYNTEISKWNNYNNLIRSGLGSNVLVSTYTYKQLVGMTSFTDPRSISTTYEYDSFNRLKNIKNHDGKILESYEYKYAE